MSAVNVQEEAKQVFNPYDIPENVAHYFGKNADRWQARVSMEMDKARIIATSKNGITEEDAERIAFVLWRARTCQRYVKTDAGKTMPWADAVEHANLRDAVWDIANNRRVQAKEQRQASNARLAAVNFEKVNGTVPEKMNAQEKVSERQAKAREEKQAADLKAK